MSWNGGSAWTDYFCMFKQERVLKGRRWKKVNCAGNCRERRGGRKEGLLIVYNLPQFILENKLEFTHVPHVHRLHPWRDNAQDRCHPQIQAHLILPHVYILKPRHMYPINPDSRKYRYERTKKIHKFGLVRLLNIVRPLE